MKLYHWTLDRKKLETDGFGDRQDRHSSRTLSPWFTDKLLGNTSSINIGSQPSSRPKMTLVTVDIPENDITPYEEKNEGSGYRAFRVPADIVNKYELRFPTVHSDRGIYKEN